MKKPAKRPQLFHRLRRIWSSSSTGYVIRRSSERDAGHLGLGAVLELEELALAEVAHPRDDLRRQGLDLRVESLDLGVVETARRLDPVLGRGQLALELEEVLVRLQVGVRLGEREQAAERLAQRA